MSDRTYVFPHLPSLSLGCSSPVVTLEPPAAPGINPISLASPTGSASSRELRRKSWASLSVPGGMCCSCCGNTAQPSSTSSGRPEHRLDHSLLRPRTGFERHLRNLISALCAGQLKDGKEGMHTRTGKVLGGSSGFCCQHKHFLHIYFPPGVLLGS